MKYSAKECECKIYFYVEDKIGKVKDVFIAKRQDILLENVLKIRKEIIEITAIGLKDTIIRGIIIKIEILMEIVIEMIELETERSILREEEEKIEEYMKNIYLNNYDQQYETMEGEQISKQAPFMSKHERICGKFSLKVVKNLENYIIIYLNRLIHGLMTVSK